MEPKPVRSWSFMPRQADPPPLRGSPLTAVLPSPCVLTINGGSSSIRFAVYEAGETARRRLDGKLDRIGSSGTCLIVSDPSGTPQVRRVARGDHRRPREVLMSW